MSRRPLGLCPCWGCGKQVDPEHIESVYGIKDRVAILGYLHPCGSEGTAKLEWPAYIAFVNRWTDFYSKKQKSYDTEAVGKAVQGFRIDLDVVETVADIALLWNDQARHEPWTIPKEQQFSKGNGRR